jgi:hypothetical protein
MVVEAAVSGGDRPGSDGGRGEVVLRPFQERKGEGHREVAHAHAGWQWWRRPVGPGRKTTGRGELAGLAKGRGPEAFWQRWPKRRERRVGQPGWKQRRVAAGPNPESGQNSKEILFEFQLILEFGRTLEICTR